MKIGNRPALYKRTVDILFDAYFNDTLEHGNCFACAVGNMVAANMNIELVIQPDSRRLRWKNFSHNDGYKTWYRAIGVGMFTENLVTENIQSQIFSTGYSGYELAKIELSFEASEVGFSIDDYIFNGLVAVLEVLKEIHAVTEDEESAQRFKAHYESVLAR